MEGGEELVECGVDVFVFFPGSWASVYANANVRRKLCVGEGVRVGSGEGERRTWI